MSAQNRNKKQQSDFEKEVLSQKDQDRRRGQDSREAGKNKKVVNPAQNRAAKSSLKGAGQQQRSGQNPDTNS